MAQPFKPHSFKHPARFLFGLALLGSLLTDYGGASHAAQAAEQDAPCAGEHRDVSLPLTDLGSNVYVRMDGQTTDYIGGLYPDGSNTRPPEHEAAGLAMAGQITPLDVKGAPNESDGKIVMISVGMSNTQQEFQAFMDMVNADSDINPKLFIVSGALGGQTADRWVDSEARTWEEVNARLAHYKVSPQQVQVAWVKQTLTRGGEFPDKALELQADLEAIVRNLKALYPNIKIAFFSSRTHSYTYQRGLSPEPAALETGFAVKWMIEKQISGDPELNFDPARGEVKAPFLPWGPYLWIDGVNPRSDGQVWLTDDLAEDCTHPSLSGQKKVAEMLMAFFKTDALAVNWFLVAPPTPLPTQPIVPTVMPTTAVRPTIPAALPTETAVRPTRVPTSAPVVDNTPPPRSSMTTIAVVIGALAGVGALVVGLWLRRK